MITIDKRFSDDTKTMLKSMIGNNFENYQCDPFVYSPSVYGIVGFQINGQSYKLTNNIEVLDYFGQNEDVAVFKFNICNPEDICSQEDNGSLITNPVNCKIAEITIIEENQQLFYKDEQTYNVFIPRAIVFHFEDGHEIMFEKDIWFSETITVHKGYNLKEKITSTDEFLENWEDSADYSPRCMRNEIIIK